METIEKNGAKYVLVPSEAWQKIINGDANMPEFPEADAHGNRPALESIRVSIARSIIRDRLARGWSQAELARQSGLPVETLNRIERARVTADESTIKRLDKALTRTARPLAKPTGRRSVKKPGRR